MLALKAYLIIKIIQHVSSDPVALGWTLIIRKIIRKSLNDWKLSDMLSPNDETI